MFVCVKHGNRYKHIRGRAIVLLSEIGDEIIYWKMIYKSSYNRRPSYFVTTPRSCHFFLYVQSGLWFIYLSIHVDYTTEVILLRGFFIIKALVKIFVSNDVLAQDNIS